MSPGGRSFVATPHTHVLPSVAVLPALDHDAVTLRERRRDTASNAIGACLDPPRDQNLTHDLGRGSVR